MFNSRIEQVRTRALCVFPPTDYSGSKTSFTVKDRKGFLLKKGPRSVVEKKCKEESRKI